MSNRQLPDHVSRSHAPARQPQSRPPISWPVREQQATQNDRAAHIARQHVQRTYSQEGEPNQEPQSEQQPMHGQPYDWSQYHTAWQQYYHQYFYRYYAGWWHQQKKQQETTSAEPLSTAPPEEDLPERQKVAKEIREKVRTTVEKQSKKVTASSHFKPIIAAVTVGTLFLLVNYNQILIGTIKQYIAPGGEVTTPVIVEPSAQAMVGPEPKIIIPKIGIEAPVVYDEPKVDEASYQAALERGVVRLGTSANPGTKGNTVIGGHSSNNVFNAGGYKYVFVNLKRLGIGDIFYLNFEGKRYTYKVTVANKIVSPKDVSVLAQTEKPTVTLFTCDPPGTNVNRLVVQAEQIDPDPSAAAANANQQTDVNQNNPLPSVAPSLWDRLF